MPERTTTSWESEIESMKEITRAIEPLDDDSRRRVLCWVWDRFSVPLTVTCKGHRQQDKPAEDDS